MFLESRTSQPNAWASMISSQRHLPLFRAGCLSLGGDTPNTTRVLTQFGGRSIFRRLQPAKPYLDALASVLVSLSIYVTRLRVGVRALGVCRLRHLLPAAAPCMWQARSGPAQIMVRPVSSGEPAARVAAVWLRYTSASEASAAASRFFRGQSSWAKKGSPL